MRFIAILNDFYLGDFDVVGATAYSFARFGQGIGPIFLDNVACVGTESRLIDCPANPIGTHNCVHSEDAGVGCLAPVVTTPAGIVSTTLLQFGVTEIFICIILWYKDSLPNKSMQIMYFHSGLHTR